MMRPFVLVGFIYGVLSLTETEISKFGTSGKIANSYVRVDSTPSDRHLIYASGIPDHKTEVVNPNTPTNQNYNVSIPKVPEYNQGFHGCLSLGMIGITRTGVAIYNPLTGTLQNAVEGGTQEVFDSCDGHTSGQGSYHYHKIPDSCLYKGVVDEFIGVALDGFPIYGPKVSDINRDLTSDDLDECHGREVNGSYRYHVTNTWPYFLGCFKGIVIQERRTEYICQPSNKSTSGWQDWQEWTWYMCGCPMGGAGQGGDGRPAPGECRMDNPNRPANCPNVSECIDNENPPSFCYEICQNNREMPPPFCRNLPRSTTTSDVSVCTTNDPPSFCYERCNNGGDLPSFCNTLLTTTVIPYTPDTSNRTEEVGDVSGGLRVISSMVNIILCVLITYTQTNM